MINFYKEYNMKQYNSLVFVWLLVMTMLFLGSCTKMDHYYKDFLIDREYIGIADSIWIQPGDQRAKISMTTPSDSQAKLWIIKWDEADSLVVDIDPEQAIQSTIIEGLEERPYIINAYTSDGQGKRSLNMELNTNIYGDVFRAQIQDRPLSHTMAFTDSVAFIWNLLIHETLFGVEIEFTDTEGVNQTILTPASEALSIIHDADQSQEISVKTAYLPEENAFEYFYTEPTVIDLEATKKNTFTFSSTGYQDAAYVDFNLARSFGQDDIPSPTGAVLDLCYALGSGTRANLLTMDSPSYSAFDANWLALISTWSKRNAGLMKLNRGPEALDLYTNLDENNRVQMQEAYETSSATPSDRLYSLMVDDVILLHSVDRGLYVAMKVLEVPPAISGAQGDFTVEFKISRP